MDLETWAHALVVLLIVVDVGSHLWHHRPWRKEKRYTLKEARALLFDQIVADCVDRMTPKPIGFKTKKQNYYPDMGF